MGTENSRRPLQREIKKKKGKKIKAVIQTELVRQRRLVQRMRKRKEQISPPKNIKKGGRRERRRRLGGGEKKCLRMFCECWERKRRKQREAQLERGELCCMLREHMR